LLTPPLLALPLNYLPRTGTPEVVAKTNLKSVFATTSGKQFNGNQKEGPFLKLDKTNSKCVACASPEEWSSGEAQKQIVLPKQSGAINGRM
jgi:hypothetical protein